MITIQEEIIIKKILNKYTKEELINKIYLISKYDIYFIYYFILLEIKEVINERI